MPGLVNMASTKKADYIQFGIIFRRLEVRHWTWHGSLFCVKKILSKTDQVTGLTEYAGGELGWFLKFPFQLSFLSHIFYNLTYAWNA